MTEFMSRSSWTDDPFPDGAAMLDPAEVEGFAVHWPGGSGSLSAANSVAILNGELKYHTNPEPSGRGWSDIAYQYAIDQAGRVWTLRGALRRSAANGSATVNERFGAITCLIGSRDTPSPALLQAVRDFRSKVWLARYPKATKVVCHSDIRPDGTECPGDKLRAHVRAGTFTTTGDIVTTLDEQDRDWLEKAIRAGVLAVLTEKRGRLGADPQLANASYADGIVVGARARLDSTAAVADLKGYVGERLDALAGAVAGIPPAVDVTALAGALAPLLQQPDVDEAELAQAIVAAMPDGLAQTTADVLAQRLAS